MSAETSRKVDIQPHSTLYDDTARRADSALKNARGKKSAAAFRTISEVADDLGVQQHVLRFWETKFSQVKPLKRGGGRRYYRPEDVDLLKAIHALLYIEGYTIKGVQKLLREAGKKRIIDNFSTPSPPPAPVPVFSKDHAPDSIQKDAPTPGNNLNAKQRRALEDILSELKNLRGMVKPNTK